MAQGAGFMAQGAWFRGLFKVPGSGFRVQGFGFRVAAGVQGRVHAALGTDGTKNSTMNQAPCALNPEASSLGG